MIHPPKAQAGDVVAVVSPPFAAPAHFPAVHEQARSRLAELTGLAPREYLSTRKDSTPQERARDLNVAFGDPEVRAVISVIGGDDQLLVIPHLDAAAIRKDPLWPGVAVGG